MEAQALVQGRGQTSGAIDARHDPGGDVRAAKFIAGNIKSGSLQGFGDGDYGGDLILVGDRLAAAMGVGPGDTLTLTSPSGPETAFGAAPVSKAFTVAGTFSVGMSQYDESFIYMPLAQAQLFFGRGASADQIEIKLDDADRTAEIQPLVQQAVGPDGVVTDWRDQEQAYFNALEVERTTMTLIMGLLVLIAAANIISCLIMLVKNKSRDIAVLRTLGAGQGAILRIFFLNRFGHRRTGNHRGPRPRHPLLPQHPAYPGRRGVGDGHPGVQRRDLFPLPHPGQDRLARGRVRGRLLADRLLCRHPAAGAAGRAPGPGRGAAL